MLVGGGKGIGQENWRMVVGGWWLGRSPPRPQCLQVFVACTMKLYRQIYRQKHSVVQWTASDSTGQCKDQIKLILEVDQAKFEVSC